MRLGMSSGGSAQSSGLKSLEDIKKMSESNVWTNAKGETIVVNGAKKQNIQALRENLWMGPEIRSYRESFMRKHGYDWADSTALPVSNPRFSWKKVANKLGHATVDSCLREADSATTFVAQLRAGIQNLVNNSYETVETTFESWTSTVNSERDTELYAPLHGISFMREVGKQELYSESYAAGLDIKIINRKYGEIYAVERELLEDDQTGQFAKQSGLLGEYAKLCWEVIAYAKLAGVFTGGAKAQYAGLVIPNTETKPDSETNYPFVSQTQGGFQGGGYNRPDAFTILDQTGIQNGFIAMMNQRNLLGLIMNVNPKRLICGPKNRFTAAVLLNSSFYPSSPGSSGTTGATFAINPIESIASLTVSRFVFSNTGVIDGTSMAWYLMDDSKPCFVLQVRESASVLQENPASGESFNRDIIRFRLTLRGNGDWIDPRYCWQGNDGSVTS
jgi:phage major head subunit gpT-like protein